jgi:hypothetical protein
LADNLGANARRRDEGVQGHTVPLLMATANIVGNIPEPEQLYGRDDLIANLWRQIGSNNILLLAPRRFGKSGVMRHVLLRPRPGFLPIYLDL